MSENNLKNQTVLLVDDEQHILTASSLSLRSKGILDVLTLQDSREVLPTMSREPIAAVVLDLHMPHHSGQDLLEQITNKYPGTPVILMTANDDIQTVVSCMKAGAFDYLVKPVDSEQLVNRVKKALELRSLSSELHLLKQRLLTDTLEHPQVFASIVTQSKSMRGIFQYVEVVAKTRQPIIVTGETGVGKELLAKAIHELSGVTGKFVALNVAGLDDNMFSDTLFGHRKGAFTGADHAREGLIEKAAGGTLFLDEIGDLKEASQLKLLRLLQEQEYYPVGSDILKKSNARIVLATNRDLQALISDGSFRNDLYYRLYSHRIHIPPLRERPEDIPLLLDYFLSRSSKELNKKKPTVPPELSTLLSLHNSPGNIRELEALVFDSVARHNSGVLSMESFREIIGDQQTLPAQPAEPTDLGNSLVELFGHFPTISELEQLLTDEALKRTNGNQGMAAKMLGIGRQTLNKRLQNK